MCHWLQVSRFSQQMPTISMAESWLPHYPLLGCGQLTCCGGERRQREWGGVLLFPWMEVIHPGSCLGPTRGRPGPPSLLHPARRNANLHQQRTLWFPHCWLLSPTPCVHLCCRLVIGSRGGSSGVGGGRRGSAGVGRGRRPSAGTHNQQLPLESFAATNYDGEHEYTNTSRPCELAFVWQLLRRPPLT